MTLESLEFEQSAAVAHVWLNRPEVHNAFDAQLIAELTQVFGELADDARVRVIILGGRGKCFSAGANAQWMRQQGAAGPQANLEDARKLAALFQTIASSPKPTIARVHGAAIGGGVGLVAACDIAVGSTGALFAMSEVRLGLIPATIAPYVIKAIGERQARRFFLTAERMDANTAQRIGLLHEAVSNEELDERIDAITAALLEGGPESQKAAKDLIAAVSDRPLTDELSNDTARRIAQTRSAAEAREGLSAFLEKRKPAWSPQP